MIVKEDFLNKLRQFFGLNLYEVRIWTALLSRGVSTAGELSDIGDVPRSRTYDVLESLEKKGFVMMKLGKPIQYLAVEPKEVVERVKKSIKDDANKNIQKLKDLSNTDILTELTNLHTQGIEFVEPTDLSGSIRGRHNIYTHLETMVKKAEDSVTIVTTEKGLPRKTEALSHLFAKLAKKGVSIKIAAPVSEEDIGKMKDITKHAEVKNVENLDARFVVVDGKEVLFMVTDDEAIHPSYDVGVWINAPFFAGALESLTKTTVDK
ncbi:TrmB family transcriptional regulator [archaeon]|jgi:HTH-type transcriptional regulator, sugar sensing transcriptional regulator|nr:TrmB family transcriptional regulator [archaeon]MBT6824393.1 TrmB family transcriptional regulator [archaeon]MBT7107328.1 TrmB family transcriptional regulator [archaeon]MBT7297369.1 TrmB family transcriptional regulator [archaeon]